MRKLKLVYVDEHGNEHTAAEFPMQMLGATAEAIETSVGMAFLMVGEAVGRVSTVVPMRQRIADRILQES